MSTHLTGIEEVVGRDPRFDYRAYEFVFEALAHTLKRLNKLPSRDSGSESPHHVSAHELLDGIRDLALEQFGMMARTVFRMWGIQSTDDFGEIVFNLVEAKLMSTSPEDKRHDFHAAYDFDVALEQAYEIRLDEAP
jgi:uncharacterized repeat protein (TIGR04138 family)